MNDFTAWFINLLADNPELRDLAQRTRYTKFFAVNDGSWLGQQTALYQWIHGIYRNGDVVLQNLLDFACGRIDWREVNAWLAAQPDDPEYRKRAHGGEQNSTE